MMGATILIFVTAAGLWIGATGDNLRRAIRIGLASLVVVGFTADGCGAPLWVTILLGLLFAVMGFMLERKKEEVGDFSNFFDD
jgi:type III secretory pathway component EscV